MNQLMPSPYTQSEYQALDELLHLSQTQQLSRIQVENLEELRRGRFERSYETGSLCVSDLVPIIVNNGTSIPSSEICPFFDWAVMWKSFLFLNGYGFQIIYVLRTLRPLRNVYDTEAMSRT